MIIYLRQMLFMTSSRRNLSGFETETHSLNIVLIRKTPKKNEPLIFYYYYSDVLKVKLGKLSRKFTGGSPKILAGQ